MSIWRDLCMFRDTFFRSRPRPVKDYHDSSLGDMQWSDDDDSWRGELNGVVFYLGYDYASKPRRSLLEYAFRILSRIEFIAEAIATAKREAIGRNPKMATEIEALSLGSVSFWESEGQMRILADLEGGEFGRSWRIEFRDDNCEGIGFDD